MTSLDTRDHCGALFKTACQLCRRVWSAVERHCRRRRRRRPTLTDATDATSDEADDTDEADEAGDTEGVDGLGMGGEWSDLMAPWG